MTGDDVPVGPIYGPGYGLFDLVDLIDAWVVAAAPPASHPSTQPWFASLMLLGPVHLLDDVWPGRRRR